MSNDQPGESPVSYDLPEDLKQQQQQERRFVVPETEIDSCYANQFMVQGTGEEVAIHLGFASHPQAATIRMAERVIISYPTAKRLMSALGSVVAAYEKAHGEIRIQPGQPAPRPQG